MGRFLPLRHELPRKFLDTFGAEIATFNYTPTTSLLGPQSLPHPRFRGVRSHTPPPPVTSPLIREPCANQAEQPLYPSEGFPN